ncbi:phosphatase PAP2 family protein [Candidatus Parcubacteria bacterium]|nr:phosphatase PAP2 family protein [Candidatus Parcubacteria bacterium]
MSLDLSIFNVIHGFAGKNSILDAAGIFLADYFPYFLGLGLLSLLFFKKYRTMASLALASGLVARFAVKGVILLFYQRPRPFMDVPEFLRLIWTPVFEDSQSFPSGHALFFFAASAIVYYFNKKWGIAFFVASLIIGIARIFAGVHWPADIAAGAILGTLTSFIIYQFYLMYKKNHDQQR